MDLQFFLSSVLFHPQPNLMGHQGCLTSIVGCKNYSNWMSCKSMMPIPIPPAIPKAIAQYLGRCSAGEELVAWWEMPSAKDPHEAMWVITYDRPRNIFIITSFPEVVSHWSHQLYGSNADPAILRRHLSSGLWSAPGAVKSAVEAFLSSMDA